jgi:hypothetical protein
MYAAALIASCYQEMGLKRKYAFYIRQLALFLHKHANNPHLSLAFFKKLLPVYYLDKSQFITGGYSLSSHKGWPLIQKVLCKEMLDAAESTKGSTV